MEIQVRRSWRLVLSAFLAFLLAAVAFTWASAQTFPPLSGRIVDTANLLDASQEAAITAKLAAHEEKTSDQVVVATIPSLEGYAIEDYANRLFRHWRLGQERRNNGVLLLVAPRERKVRIEVGYGLEGALTDALSKVIIATAVAPRFQRGDFAGGIDAGTDAILSILTGDAEEWQRRGEIREDESSPAEAVVTLIILFVLVAVIRRMMSDGGGPRRPHRTRRGGWVAVPGGAGWGGGWSGRSRGGGFSGGGFSGGGGSSGGGGASGSW